KSGYFTESVRASAMPRVPFNTKLLNTMFGLPPYYRHGHDGTRRSRRRAAATALTAHPAPRRMSRRRRCSISPHAAHRRFQ
ncbi:hypothetical protein HMPREF0044_0566, partial [Gleimia coleocanis DSM 15436]